MRARELDRAEFQSDIEPRDRVDPHLYPRQAHRAKALFLRLEGEHQGENAILDRIGQANSSISFFVASPSPAS